MTEAAYNEAHYRRARQALAAEICAIGMTDGFCGPRAGACCHHAVDSRPQRNCIRRAESLLMALDGVGCKVVWVYDRELPETLVKAELQR